MSCMQKNKIVLLTAILTLVLSTSAFGDSLTITASASPKAGGSISPSGRVAVGYGEDLQFTITPNTGYQIKDVTVDRVSQGAVDIYTFTNVTQKHTIKATFTKQTFTVTIAQGGNVTVSPVGTQTVTYGKKLKLKIKPNNQDVVPILLVNGEQVDATKSGNVYEFSLTVLRDTTIYATSAVEPVLGINVKGADVSTAQYLSSVAPDQSVLTFTQITPYLQSLQPGDVIVIEPTDAAPNGLVRKVTSISSRGSEIIVETTPATLEDVIEEGEFIVNQALTSTDIESFVPLVEGVTLQQKNVEGQQQYVLCLGRDAVLASNATGQIRLKGEVCVDPVMKFGFRIKWFTLQKFYFIVGFKEKIEVELDAQYTSSLAVETALATIRFKRIRIPYTPFWILPIFTLNVGIEGQVSAGLSTSVFQEGQVEVGADYQRGKGWTLIKNYSATYGHKLPSLYANMSVRAYAGPQFDLLILDIAGPYVALEGYLGLKMAPTSNPWLSLIGGVEIGGGVDVNLLSIYEVDYEIKPRFDYHKTLIELPGNVPPTITSLTADPTAVYTGNTSTVTVAASDPENDPLTCSWSASGGTLYSSTIQCGSVNWSAPSTPGSYKVSVGVSDNQPGHGPITGAVSISVLPLPASYAALTAKKSGSGSGTVTGKGINCGGDCSENYAVGTSVTLTANSIPGASFDSWAGCDSTTGNVCTVTMNQNRTVTAIFNQLLPPGYYMLTVKKSQTSGTVTGPGIDCGADCYEGYASGTSVSLTANSIPGASFGSWAGCDSISGNICTVTMNQNRTVTATFSMVLPP